MKIFHVTTKRRWQEQGDQRTYAPETFSKDGFIHCCTPAQLPGVLQRYFLNQKDLLLLHLDTQRLLAELKFEVSTGGEPFPHLYGVINKDAISHIEPLP